MNLYAVVLGAAWLVPLALALGLACRPRAMNAARWVTWGPLPALLLALIGASDRVVDMPALLVGARFAMDDTGRVFLAFTAVVWMVAGGYARRYLAGDPRAPSFFVFFLLAEAGNLGLILARDALSFYTFFALMSFAAYPLVVHPQTESARRAGRIYIVLVVISEAMIFPALSLLAAEAGRLDIISMQAALAESPHRTLLFTLLGLGFGIKAGALPLHVWLPLAHPEAPTPASATLSGCMIKAGLLGWLRFLPLGLVSWPGPGLTLMLLGAAAALGGLAAGLFQTNPKTLLAYSSISKMGLMTALLGIGLADRNQWPAADTAILVFAAHHALAKSTLFLSVGVGPAIPASGAARRWMIAGLLIPAVSFMAFPFTGGAIAKLPMKVVMAPAPGYWAHGWETLLAIAAVATAVLMVQFLHLVWPRPAGRAHRAPAGLRGPWAIAVVIVLLGPAMGLVAGWGPWVRKSLLWPSMLGLTWPALLGVLLAVGLQYRPRFGWKPVPAGDVLAWYVRLLQALRRAIPGAVRRHFTREQSLAVYFINGWRRSEGARAALERMDVRLAGAAWLGLIVLTLLGAAVILLQP